jgi:hypothetical protein
MLSGGREIVGYRQSKAPSHTFEDVIGQLHRHRGHGVDAIVSNFPAQQRARLALFCFGRAHMREIGVAIAATCEEDVLVEIGAAAGAALFAISRERPVLDKGPSHARPKISLAQAKPVAAPFEDADPDEDGESCELEAEMPSLQDALARETVAA